MSIKEIFSDAYPLIERFAPSLARAIGGFPAIAASYVIPLLAEAFNSPGSDIKQLVSNIMNDPENEVKLDSIEHVHGDWICSLLGTVDRLTSAEITIKLEWNKS